MRAQVKIWNSSKARENAGDLVTMGNTIDVTFASDWFKEWCKFSTPITERCKAKLR